MTGHNASDASTPALIETRPEYPRVTLATTTNPGAVAIVQVNGPRVRRFLQRFTGLNDWPLHRVRFVRFGKIDSGLAVMMRDDWAQLMPHGGPRVTQKLIEALIEAGAAYAPNPPAGETYPEADSDLEADMLATIARAASPAAIDLLLAQPARWRTWLDGRVDASSAQILQRSATLARLIDPPSVVVIGRPNVGKSTLTNRLLGRAASIVADLPGTTRDWVAGIAELSPVRRIENSASAADGIAVRWLDTPGLRQSDDEIEHHAIKLANGVIAAADVLIAMRDPETNWPVEDALPRKPDLWVLNKIDVMAAPPRDEDGHEPTAPLAISAKTGKGIDRLQEKVVRTLGPRELNDATPWAFNATIRELLGSDDLTPLRRYAGA